MSIADIPLYFALGLLIGVILGAVGTVAMFGVKEREKDEQA